MTYEIRVDRLFMPLVRLVAKSRLWHFQGVESYTRIFKTCIAQGSTWIYSIVYSPLSLTLQIHHLLRNGRTNTQNTKNFRKRIANSLAKNTDGCSEMLWESTYKPAAVNAVPAQSPLTMILPGGGERMKRWSRPSSTLRLQPHPQKLRPTQQCLVSPTLTHLIWNLPWPMSW